MPPSIGLLSRTAVRSPTVHWILPGRIRHKDKADVIFIGENFVHIKELLPNSQLEDPNFHLEDVCTKTDFDHKILSAKVIGYHVDDLMSGSDFESRRPKRQVTDDGDTEMASVSDERAQLPPQMLVLSMDSNELVFLYASEDDSGNINFIHSRRALPGGVSLLERYGRHMAIDPR